MRGGGHPGIPLFKSVADNLVASRFSSQEAGAARSSRSATTGIKLSRFPAHSSASPAPRQQVLRGKHRLGRQKSQQAEQEFRGVETKPGEAADQRAVEADILQVAADIDLDQRDQLRHVPALDLVGDEGLNAALLVGDE